MALKNFAWCVNAGATQNTELKTRTTQFGDGYEQVSSTGINNVSTSWQVAKTGDKVEIDAIYNFLIEHKGVKPFYMTIAGETKTYRTEGSIGKPQISGRIWEITFTVKQVFIP